MYVHGRQTSYGATALAVAKIWQKKTKKKREREKEREEKEREKEREMG